MISIVVVLPAPLGPRSPKQVPSGTAKETPSTAVTEEYCLTRLWTSRIGGLSGTASPGRTHRMRRAFGWYYGVATDSAATVHDFQYGNVPVAVVVRQGRHRRVERPREPACQAADGARLSHRPRGGGGPFQDLGARGGALSRETSLMDRAQARGGAAAGGSAGSFSATADRAAGVRGDLAHSSCGRD